MLSTWSTKGQLIRLTYRVHLDPLLLITHLTFALTQVPHARRLASFDVRGILERGEAVDSPGPSF